MPITAKTIWLLMGLVSQQGDSESWEFASTQPFTTEAACKAKAAEVTNARNYFQGARTDGKPVTKCSKWELATG